MLDLKHIKPTTGDRIYRIVALIVLGLIIFIIAYPLYFILCASFSNPVKLYDNPFLLFPRDFTIENYKTALANKDVWIGYRNSLFYTFAGTTINIIMTILGAYPLSRRDFAGRNALTFFYTFTMFFGGGLIPSYLINKSLGLYNNVWAMIIPTAVSVYNMIIMRTFFQTNIPTELEESAMLDGCSNFRMLLSIVLPLSTPIISVMILFYGVGNWNAYFNALIYLNDRNLLPLQMILREILIQNEMTNMMSISVDAEYANRMMEQMGLKYVVVVISTLPIFVIFPFMQKFFKQGIMVGALKG